MNPIYLVGIFFIMLGLSFLSVPLYDLFCRVTGFGGTVSKSNYPKEQILDQKIGIRFDTNVAKSVPFNFKVENLISEIKIGEVSRVKFTITNESAESIKVNSTFNTSPPTVGLYFKKIQCFCFEQQDFKGKETKEFELIYYISPKIVESAATKDVKDITLSYTLFEVQDPKS